MKIDLIGIPTLFGDYRNRLNRKLRNKESGNEFLKI